MQARARAQAQACNLYVTVRADCQGTRYEVTVYNKQTMSCEDLCTGGEVVYIRVAQGSGPCSCIRVAITTREVSAVTL